MFKLRYFWCPLGGTSITLKKYIVTRTEGWDRLFRMSVLCRLILGDPGAPVIK